MAKAIFVMPFDVNLPRLLDPNGVDRIQCASRVGEAPIEGIGTNLVMIEADDATLAVLENNPDYVRMP